eukprot:scaffold2619_cov129-Cylindrotheca_fusiformis.AAC.16
MSSLSPSLQASAPRDSHASSIFDVPENDDEEEEENSPRLETQVATPPPPQPPASGAPPSAVHGKGMWNNFLRSFSDPLYALLDLFDNAVDASWSLVPEGKSGAAAETALPKIKVDLDDLGQNGIVLRNATGTAIPPMVQILEIFRSSKDSQAIGENGVGIKHACANLSDLSFVLTQTEDFVAIGILMKELQTDVPCFPHVTFSKRSDFFHGLKSKCDRETSWKKALEVYGDGDYLAGIDRIHFHFQEMKNGADWKKYTNVFTIILAKLRQTAVPSATSSSNSNPNTQWSAEQGRRLKDYELDIYETGDDAGQKSRHLLNEFAKRLPQYYIHIHDILTVYICGKQIPMIYWESKLAELSLFEVAIPQEPENDDDDDDDDNNRAGRKAALRHADPPYAHPTVRFWVGFDVSRPSGSAHLYYYSRQSGRLIKDMPDCRTFLNLTAGSSDFKQGLTIVIDDYQSTLPLNPTKQDLSFAFQEHGETHKKNLIFWMSGIANFFWTYHFERKGSSKLQLTESVKLAEPLMKEAVANQTTLIPLNRIRCIRFPNVGWSQRKTVSHDADGRETWFAKLFVPLRQRTNATRVVGPDTLVQLPAPTKGSAVRVSKRKRRRVCTLLEEATEENKEQVVSETVERGIVEDAGSASRFQERVAASKRPATRSKVTIERLDWNAKIKEIQQLKNDKAKLEQEVARLKKATMKRPRNRKKDIHLRVINHETDRCADLRVTASSTETILEVLQSEKVLRQSLFLWPTTTSRKLREQLAVLKVGVWDPSKPKGDYKYVYDQVDLGTETTKNLVEHNNSAGYNGEDGDPICICMFVEDAIPAGVDSEEAFGLQQAYDI